MQKRSRTLSRVGVVPHVHAAEGVAVRVSRQVRVQDNTIIDRFGCVEADPLTDIFYDW
jgi:hypothetical protein